MPHTTAKVWAQLGLGDIEAAARNGELKELKWGGLKPGTRLGALAPIFPRAPKELAQVMTDMEAQNNPATPKYGDSGASLQNDESSGAAVAAAAAPESPSEKSVPSVSSVLSSSPESPQISIEDFAKVDLRVARVLVAERIPKADKLLRLEVDLGYEKRQILAGIDSSFMSRRSSSPAAEGGHRGESDPAQDARPGVAGHGGRRLGRPGRGARAGRIPRGCGDWRAAEVAWWLDQCGDSSPPAQNDKRAKFPQLRDFCKPGICLEVRDSHHPHKRHL